MIKKLIVSVLLFWLLPIVSSIANANNKANIIHDYLEQKYWSLNLEQQISQREKMNSVFYLIKWKTNNLELLDIVNYLIEKSEQKLLEIKSDSSDSDSKSDLDIMRQDMLDLINSYRNDCWLSNLSLNDQLNSAAQKHAEYMAQSNDFAHTTKNWLTFDVRIKNEWYDWYTMWENIARNQRTVEQVMTAWMNSEWHRSNILNTKYKEVWIWLSEYYRVQNFWAQ